MPKKITRIICITTLIFVMMLMGTAGSLAADEPAAAPAGVSGAEETTDIPGASGEQNPDAQDPDSSDPSTQDSDTSDPEADDPDEQDPAADDPVPTEVKPDPVKTRISGFPSKLSKEANAKVTFTIKVTPAKGTRTVKLQQYSSSSKSWRTRAVYQTEDRKKAAVEVTIAKKYRKKATGKWRVYVPATDQAKRAVSRVCKVTSRNIETVDLDAKSACIYCVNSGALIYGKEQTARRSPASTTKLMTSLILVESGKLKKKTSISAKAANTPWGSGRLMQGDRYRNIDLLYAMLLPSANDAAVAVAEGVSGSTDKFVKRMNRKAKKLGLKNTHFCNPHGLHNDDHYTTALELARLTACAYEKKEIRKAIRTRVHTIRSVRYHRAWTLYSTDSLLGVIQNFLGGKTGTGSDAKYCFAGVYKHNKKTYVTVVLGANNAAQRWNDTRKLHSYIREYAATKY